MSDTPTPEAGSVARSYVLFTTPDGSIRLRTTINLHHVGREHGEAFDAFSKVVEERDEARRDRDELKRAAIEVLNVVPVAYCSEMYHGKRDMHSALEPCPVVERYNARIDKLRALLKEEA